MLSPHLSQDPRRKKGEGSACNAGNPGSIPGSGRPAGEGIALRSPVFLGFPCGSASKEAAHNVLDLGWIPGLGRSPGEGKGSPLQYSGLENSMICTAHGVTKSRTRLSSSHFQPQEGPVEPGRLGYEAVEWASCSWPAGSLGNQVSAHRRQRAVPAVSGGRGGSDEGGPAGGPCAQAKLEEDRAGVILRLLPTSMPGRLLKAIANQLTLWQLPHTFVPRF